MKRFFPLSLSRSCCFFLLVHPPSRFFLSRILFVFSFLDLVVDDVLEVLGELPALVGLDGLLDLDTKGHDRAAELALARARGDVGQALGAGADRGLGVEVLKELDEREHDEEVDDEADGDEGDQRVDKVPCRGLLIFFRTKK